MFGYVRPMDCELKVKDQGAYKAAYCGLCKAIKKRHGAVSVLSLNYDCTFLALLLTALNEQEVCYKKCRCLHRCNQPGKRRMDTNPSLLYAADINVLLTYYKCRDDWADERKLSRRLYAALLQRRIKRIRLEKRELAESIERWLKELDVLEKAYCDEPDRVADCFSNLLCDIGRLAPGIKAKNEAALHWLLYNLGRWIYLIDAVFDRDEDKRMGRYNPFIVSASTEQAVAYSLYKSLEEAAKALNLLDLRRYGAILENIITLGCVQKTRSILKEKLDESL